MAPRRIMLSQILGRLSKKDAIVVRVVRMWLIPYRDNANGIRLLSMVLQDETGVRIHATVERGLIEQFRGKIEEHGLYIMKNFNVKECDRDWRPASHPYKLCFHADTNVSDNVFGRVKDFPMQIYKFKPYEEIMQTPENDQSPELLDFIGVLIPGERVWYGKKRDGDSNYLSFTLRDMSNNEIPCTLWDNYADVANPVMNKRREGHVVILLQLCRISRRRDTNAIGLATSFHVTKVLIDEHIPEIEEFRSQYTAVYHLDSRKGSSLSISSASVAGVGPVAKINKLFWLKQAKGYWFYGEIRTVLKNNKCIYPGCIDESCNGRVYLDGDGYLCDNHACKKRMAKPVQRYSVKVIVEHKEDSVFALLLDELCTSIVGKTAMELLCEIGQADTICEPPREILELEGKSFFFKISGYSPANEEGREYYISQVNDDATLIAEYNEDEGCTSEESDSDNNLDLLLDVATQADSNKPLDPKLKVDEADAITPSSKRHRDDDDDQSGATPDTQNSANKKLKNIKIEKP